MNVKRNSVYEDFDRENYFRYKENKNYEII